MQKGSLQLLFVTNLYPPISIGGYELRCSQIAEGLQRRGHKVRIVTSTYGLSQPNRVDETLEDPLVDRVLNEYSLNTWHQYSKHYRSAVKIWNQYKDIQKFIGIVDDFRPDIICWWNLSGLAKGILPIANQMKLADIHFLEDLWMRELRTEHLGDSLGWERFWRNQFGFYPVALIKKLLIPLLRWYIKRQGISCNLNNLTSDWACYVSKYQKFVNKDSRIKFNNTSIIYGGIDAHKFFIKRDWQKMSISSKPLAMLYCGSVTESRRLHIIIESLELMSPAERSRFQLTIIGRPPTKKHESYYQSLNEKVANNNLGRLVVFEGQQPYEKMPEIYAKHDIMIFPSTRPEGLPLSMTEAMMSGCCILTNGSGGAAELALAADLPLFPTDSSIYLCHMLLKLEKDRNLLVEHARRGQEIASKKFTFERMLDSYEETLARLVHTP